MNRPNRFSTHVLIMILGVSFSATGAAATGAAESDAILDFARRNHIHGVPFAEVRPLDPDVAIAPLVEMLGDPGEAEHWEKAVAILGMLGDERAIDPLLAKLREHSGPGISRHQYRAAKTVPVALGYIANLSGGNRAMDILTASLDEGGWAAMGVSWTSDRYPTAELRDAKLKDMSLLGLAVSGRPDAEEALQSERRISTQKSRGPAGAEGTDLASEALVEHAEIGRIGLDCYHDSECRAASQP